MTDAPDIEVEGLPMPLRAWLRFPDWRREELRGVICQAGEMFGDAVARIARENGAEVFESPHLPEKESAELREADL